MNIAVCVKQIPDPAVPGKLEADHTLERAGKLILDDSDAYGVEMALQLADKAGGGDVVLVSMAPNLGWINVPLGARLARALSVAVPISVLNDADAGVLGEHRRGAGAEERSPVVAEPHAAERERGRGAGVRRAHRALPAPTSGA